VVAAADPGEVLVSSTVKHLDAGSGITFADRGLHALKRPLGWEPWQLPERSSCPGRSRTSSSGRASSSQIAVSMNSKGVPGTWKLFAVEG
jgi:hypothetical protein